MLTPESREDVENLESVKRLVSGGITSDWTGAFGMSFLHLVTMSGNHEGVIYLISKDWNADIRVTSNEVPVFEDMSPIHVAAYCGRLDCLRALLASKSVANATAGSGLTPLHYACVGSALTAEVLLPMGADPNARDSGGETPLIQACGSATIGKMAPRRILESLLDNGADPKVISENGLTALHLAADAGDEFWVKRFLDLGIAVNYKDCRGETPLHRAARCDDDAICLTLIRAGADVNSQSEKDETPLSVALRHGAMNAAKVLLEHGATGDVVSPPAKPRSSHHVTLNLEYSLFEERREKASVEMARALILAGANIKASDKNGITPLHICFLPRYFGRLTTEFIACFSDLV